MKTFVIFPLAIVAASLIAWQLRATDAAPANVNVSQEEAKSMAEAARKCFDVNAAGDATGSETIAWSRRLAEAEKQLARTNDQRQRACRDHLDRMKTIYDKIAVQHEAGAMAGEPKKFHAAQYYLAEAELWLKAAGG